MLGIPWGPDSRLGAQTRAPQDLDSAAGAEVERPACEQRAEASQRAVFHRIL